ncbi:MAG: type II secretion system F family protein [Fimbriimonadaceae bacterium]
MPLFQYRAQDTEGRTVEGMVTADTASAATQSLTARGFRIFDLTEKGGTVAAPPSSPAPRPAPPSVQPTPAKSFAQQVANPGAPSFHTPARRAGSQREQILLNAPLAARPAPAPTGPQRVNVPAAAPVQVVRTKRGTDKANTFLFSQLASFFRAGINPAEAFTQLSNTHPKPWYRQSLVEAAKATTEGLRFSQVLERYPDLYPPHIPGMIRAGEEGGFLVEATEAVAEQTNESLKFNRWPLLLFWWIFGNIIFLPPCIALTSALEKATDVFFGPNATPNANGTQVMVQATIQSFLWPVGPITILTTAACWGAYWWWMQLPQRMLRHRALLKVPTIGKRARSESLATFAWTLSMVSRVGIAPRTAWNAAAGAMPNLALAERMRKVGQQMHDGTKLSEAIYNSKVVPEEYGPIVSNGEMVGDVSSALMTISAASRDDFSRADGMSKMRFGCWGMLVIALVFLASGLMISKFYLHMIPTVTSTD